MFLCVDVGSSVCSHRAAVSVYLMPSRSVFLIRRPSEAGILSPIASALSLTRCPRTISVTNKSIKHQSRNHRNQHNWDSSNCCCCGYLRRKHSSVRCSNTSRGGEQSDSRLRLSLGFAYLLISAKDFQSPRNQGTSWLSFHSHFCICALDASKHFYSMHLNSCITATKSSRTLFTPTAATSNCTQLQLIALHLCCSQNGRKQTALGNNYSNPLQCTVLRQLPHLEEGMCSPL